MLLDAVGALLVLAAPTPPAGFIPVDAPTSEDQSCANSRFDDFNDLTLEKGRVKRARNFVTRLPGRDEGAKLPFTLTKQLEATPRREVLVTPGGYLIGLDAGEWGGGLIWASADGHRQVELSDENVRGLVQFGAREVVALEGLNHMGLIPGFVEWLVPGKDGAWKVTRKVELSSSPDLYLQRGDEVDVLLGDAFVRVFRDGRVRRLHEVKTWFLLLPRKITVDAQGTYWFSMVHYLLGLEPKGEGYAEHWFAPKDCQGLKRVKRVRHWCVCDSAIELDPDAGSFLPDRASSKTPDGECHASAKPAEAGACPYQSLLTRRAGLTFDYESHEGWLECGHSMPACGKTIGCNCPLGMDAGCPVPDLALCR